jgi:glycosyltransferase involved in cell wall biosynthesis
MLNLQNEINKTITKYFNKHINVNNTSWLVDGLIITTDIDNVPTDYINNLKLLVSDALIENIQELKEVHILYYNSDYSINDFTSSLIDKIAWLITIPEEFNEKNYLDNYPETTDYYQPYAKDNGYSDRQRLYHHYILYNQSDYKKSIKFTESKFPIYIKVQNGLANRLRTINSFLTLAQNTNRPLFVCWRPGPGFSDENFSDLFKEVSEFSFISEEDYIRASLESFNIDQEINKTINSLKYEYARKQEDIIKAIFNNPISYTGDSCLEYMLPSYFEYKNTLYKLLQPIPKIANKIKKIEKYFDANTIGLHIRKGDASRCPWRKFTNQNNEEFYKLLDNHDSNSSFFLATDCKQTQEEIIDKYKDRIKIHYNPDKNFVESTDMYAHKPYQSDAVVDLFLLSKTNQIIGSQFSSFSDVSAKIGNLQCIIPNTTKIDNDSIASKNITKVSIICGVMNRFEALRISLESWRNNTDQILEIIIVDWSSDLDLGFISEYESRLHIVRIDGKKHYNVSSALNEAIIHVKGDYILKLDADYILNPYYDFFNLNYINDTEFLTGDSSHRILDNSLGFLGNLHGLLFAKTQHIKEVGGFQEQVEGYGWEDSDMYNRLEKIGLKRIYLNHSRMSVFHIPHDNNVRTKHYENKLLMDSLIKNQELCKSFVLKNNVFIESFLDWQYPSITEKESFNNHQNMQNQTLDNIYVGCAWASIIDYIQNHLCLSPEIQDYWADDKKTQNYLKRIFSQNKVLHKLLERNTHTVCQHIHWKKLLGFWEYIGIKNLHISHLTTKDSHLKINLNPWHITPTNSELLSNNKKMEYKDITEKKYLYSFIGAYNKWYRSNIRPNIVNSIKPSNNNYIQLNDKWFYNKIVYNQQIKKEILSKEDMQSYENNLSHYNEILSDSVFSLCPEGTGPNTIRLWESMSIGTIPVLFENDWIRPIIDGFKWNDFSITIPQNKLQDIPNILQDITEKERRKMSINAINAYNKIRLKTCF